nr:uncharacterized protein LOC116766575 isoform X3 [Danaus plexippus plexippus]
MAFREYLSGFFHEHNAMAPFSRLYRAMVLKMNQHEDEATTSGITDDATDDLQQRVIFVNHPQPQKFVNNRISTAKYRYTLYYIPRFIIFRCSIIKLSTH